MHLAAASGPNPTRLQDRHIAGPSRQPQALVSHQDRSITSTQASHTTARLRRQPALGPVSAPVLSTCPDRCLGLRRPPPCTNVNTPPATYSAQHRRRTATALPARALFIYPGRFSSPQTAPAPGPYNSRYRECPRPRSSGGCTGADAFPYNLRLYGIKSALPGRQHERGIPLSNSPHCRGPAPHTPRQRFAAAPRPAPGAGPVDTPRQRQHDQLANIATQAQTWTHATPHYSTLHKATRTRAQPQTQTPGTDNRRGHTESTRTISTLAKPGGPSRLVPHTLRAAPDRSRTPASARSRHAATPAGLRGTPAGAPSRLVPHTLGAPAYHSQTQQARARPAIDMHHHWAALRFTLALASLDLGLRLGRPIDADDQTAPATPAVPISFGSSTRTCRPDTSGIVAALMACTLCPDPEADQSRRPDQSTGRMHGRGPPREQKLMRRPMPQLPVSTREDFVKIFFSRRTHAALRFLYAVIVQCSAATWRKIRGPEGAPRPSSAAVSSNDSQARTPESSWRIHCSGQNVPLTEAWTIGVFDS